PYVSAWYENDGAGDFSDQITLTQSNSDLKFAEITDLDQDGDMDIVFAGSGGIKWHENDGLGNFSPFITIDPEAGSAVSVCVSDLDDDGDLDIISVSFSSDKIAWYENDGDTSFGNQILLSQNTPGASTIGTGDLDGDGDSDVVSATSYGLSWFRNDGFGGFSFPIFISELEGGQSLPHATDLDGDGDLDIFCQYESGDIALFENNGQGDFSEAHIIISFGTHWDDLYPADMDGDGDQDILLISWTGSLGWAENDGDANFSYSQIANTVRYSTSVHASDMDGDGDLDILVPSKFLYRLGWFENVGDGNFSFGSSEDNGFERAGVIRGVDMDGDGDTDILCTHQPGGGIIWWENDGLGNFMNEHEFPNDSLSTVELYPFDFDGDGDIDVAASEVNQIVWYQNLGAGYFASKVVIGNTLNSARDLKIGDMDGDGDMDLLFVDPLDNKLGWHENLANEGCLDSSACNFNPIAWTENGSCCYSDCGCLNTIAENYNPEATCSDPTSCEYIEGCSNYVAVNYNPEVTLDDGSCEFIEGCADEIAENYNPEVTVDDGSCEYMEGCTNEIAANYNSEAVLDDESCTFTFTGFVYNDDDENGVYDNLDFGLSFQALTIEPLGITVITNDEGEFTFDLASSQALTFSVQFNPTFPFNTTPNPVIIDPATASSTALEFGVSNEAPLFGICIDLYPSGNGFLCNDWSNHNICYRNMGNVPIDGIVELEYDALFQGHSEVTPIDSVNGNIVYMSFQNLQPGQMFFYDVNLNTPTVDHIGEFVTSHARVTGFFEGNQVAYGEKTLEMEIACAYDPNDKQAFPLGYTDDHLLLQETEQEFLVRFQNTGNAPAQNVRIQDTLDVNFDIESFKLMANSHSVMTTIDPETRLIDFYF
ncbi:MAG: FG-GAP repeat domain-containing protein, partial [Flavobacteriales bacterium]